MNKRVFPLLLAMIVLGGGLLSAQESTAQAPDPAKPVVDAVISATQVLEGIEKASRDMGEKSITEAQPGPGGPRTYVKRPMKNSLILIAAGAVAGAGAGGAISKNSKGAMVGAILGGVAGLVYDRITAREPGI